MDARARARRLAGSIPCATRPCPRNLAFRDDLEVRRWELHRSYKPCLPTPAFTRSLYPTTSWLRILCESEPVLKHSCCLL